MNEELLTLQDIFGAIRRHIVKIAVVMVICEVLALGLLKSVPKRFRSTALLNLKTTYFEVPLLDVPIVGSRDYGEMQSQKTALLRLALSDAFIDAEGEKYGLFKSEPGSLARIGDRESLRKNIEYFSSTMTTFQITATGRSAAIAYGLASDALDQIISVLISERQKSILGYRDSLRKQLESLGVATTTEPGSAGAQPQALKDELTRLEGRMESLKAQYTPNHPKIVALAGKIRTVHQQLEHALRHPEKVSAENAPVMIDTSAKGRRTDFGEELLKKINYLDIALELETNKKALPYLDVLERPVLPNFYYFPNRNAFAIAGILAGMFISGLIVLLLEVRRVTAVTPATAAKLLGTPLFGTMPAMLSAEERAAAASRKPT